MASRRARAEARRLARAERVAQPLQRHRRQELGRQALSDLHELGNGLPFGGAYGSGGRVWRGEDRASGVIGRHNGARPRKRLPVIDPRVTRQESDQLVATMRDNGIPVRYVVFDDEGHGFMRPANAQRFHAAAEAFLAEHLGGRAEPAHADEEIEPFLR